MPIRKRAPRRKGTKPFVFFHGTLEEAKNTHYKDIIGSLEMAGLEFRDSGEAEEYAKFLKSELIDQMASGYLSPPKHIEAPFPRQTSLHLPLPRAQEAGKHVMMTIRNDGSKFTVHQAPLSHVVALYDHSSPKFKQVLSILDKGFQGRSRYNNAEYSPYFRRSHIYRHMGEGDRDPLTRGDSYGLDFFTIHTNPRGVAGLIQRAGIEDVSRINIRLSDELTKSQKKERKAFYRKELKKYGIPIKFL